MDQLDDLVFDSRLTEQARRLGIESPLEVSLIEWNGHCFYPVTGLDHREQRILIEVFRIDARGKLEAVLVFQYPPPIRDLFPN